MTVFANTILSVRPFINHIGQPTIEITMHFPFYWNGIAQKLFYSFDIQWTSIANGEELVATFDPKEL